MKTHQNPPEPDRCINSANTGRPWKIGQGSTKTLDFDQNLTQQTKKGPFPPRIDRSGGRKRLLGRRGVSGNIPIRFRFFAAFSPLFAAFAPLFAAFAPLFAAFGPFLLISLPFLCFFVLHFAAFGAWKAGLSAQPVFGHRQRKIMKGNLPVFAHTRIAVKRHNIAERSPFCRHCADPPKYKPETRCVYYRCSRN